MSIWDSIKGIGNSFGAMSSICNKSWLQIDDSGERTTFVFKPNNQLHLTINGISKIIPWKYFPENERLVIYYQQIEGVSYRYSFYEKGVLLTLKADQSGTIIILANEGNEKAPKSVSELGIYFKRKNADLVSSAISRKVSAPGYYEQVAQTIDRVLDGCDYDMLVEQINYFKQNVPGFENYYRKYINYKKYQQDNSPEYEEDANLAAHTILRDLDKQVRVQRIIPPVSSSAYLDRYLSYVGEKIDYDERIKRWMEVDKILVDFREKWG